ncbi:MAG: lysophospholipase [bacterium]|nr:lysophospholipase [bacterium]
MNEIFLQTGDNVTIAANYFQTGKSEVIIVAPGWCMTKDSNAFMEIAESFAKNFDVISFDFRGHGKSKGAFTFSAKEQNDLDAVVKYAKYQKKYQKIYLAGFSLGGGIVLIYAAQNPIIDRIISVSPHADFSKIENKMWKKEAWGETFKKFELSRFLSIRPSIIPHKKVKPTDIVSLVKAPTLFIAGAKDPTVCLWHTEELYKKATCPKELKIYKDGIHAEDLFLYNKEDFENTCLGWLREIATLQA